MAAAAQRHIHPTPLIDEHIVHETFMLIAMKILCDK